MDSEGLETRIIDVDISALTQREQQVLAMIGRGYSIPKIAEKLFRSQKTIETHRQSLGRKLGASNRVQLARIAIQVGLAPLELGTTGTLAETPDLRSELGADERAAERLQRIESACASVVDVAYAQALCQALCGTLGTAGAGLFAWENDQAKMRSVAVVVQGVPVDETSIDLAGSPCEQTMKLGFFRGEGKAQASCPALDSMVSCDVQSYMGIRLDDPHSPDPLGTLMVFLDQPAAFDAGVEPVLRVCARRAAAELGRIQLIDSLQRSVESLEERLAQIEEG